MNKKITMSLLLILLTVICLTLKGYSLPASSFIIKPGNYSGSMLQGSKIIYTLTYNSRDFILPETANQKILSISRSQTATNLQILAGEIELSDDSNLESYLANTALLRTDNSRIKNKAEKLKKQKDPLLAISLFVYNHITGKTTGIPLIPAPLIMENRTGDCTEHAVLAASLYRAAGIPSRGVTGVIFAEEFMGEKNIFVYHMWLEVYYNNRWHLVDPTRPGRSDKKRYIAFSYHDLRTEMPFSYLRALAALKGVEISFKNIETD